MLHRQWRWRWHGDVYRSHKQVSPAVFNETVTGVSKSNNTVQVNIYTRKSQHQTVGLTITGERTPSPMTRVVEFHPLWNTPNPPTPHPPLTSNLHPTHTTGISCFLSIKTEPVNQNLYVKRFDSVLAVQTCIVSTSTAALR